MAPRLLGVLLLAGYAAAVPVAGEAWAMFGDAAAFVQQRAAAFEPTPQEEAAPEDAELDGTAPEEEEEAADSSGPAPWEPKVKGDTFGDRLKNKLQTYAEEDNKIADKSKFDALTRSDYTSEINESQGFHDIFWSHMPNMTVVKDLHMQAKMEAIKDAIPFDLGHVFLNNHDKEHVDSCSEITTSLYCGMSFKMYGLNCTGWGGSTCLDEMSKCEDITVAGICNNALLKVNISCAGWGGAVCLPHGSEARRITDEDTCENSEQKLGIRSVGWTGQECVTTETASCRKIRRPGICNDARARLGIDCLGWGGKKCLSPSDAECRQIGTRHICESAAERWGISCTWSGTRQRCFNA